MTENKKRQITSDELKKIQLDILDYVTSFCDENNIHYFLDGGTLLGAIRHKGYIPWDDDIDIGMLRDDYEKMITSFNSKTSSTYRFECYETNKSFHIPFGKVINTTTVLYEPDEKGNKTGINIDIFVYDNAPDDANVNKRQFQRRDLFRNMNLVQHLNHVPNGKVIRRCVVYFCHGVLKLFPDQFFLRKMISNSKRYVKRNMTCVANYMGFARAYCNKHVFDNYVDVEFEGKKYHAPAGYDEWLRSFYGDYMQLPPVEARVSHHSFVAYVND